VGRRKPRGEPSLVSLFGEKQKGDRSLMDKIEAGEGRRSQLETHVRLSLFGPGPAG